MYYKGKEMLQKARQEKQGSHSFILERWNDDNKYRDSLSRVGLTEQGIMLFDRIAFGESSMRRDKKLREFEIRHIEF